MTQATVLTAAHKITVHGPQGPVETTVGDLLKMAPALGVEPKPSKTRRIVTPPAPASDLGKAIAGLKPNAGAVSSIVEAPKPQKTHEGVTITITKEFCTIKEGEAPVEMLVLRKRCLSEGGKGKPKKGTEMSHFNYPFDKGFCYYVTKGATDKDGKPAPKPTWKWDGEREVRFVPVEEVETLLNGLRRYYVGATLVIDGRATIL